MRIISLIDDQQLVNKILKSAADGSNTNRLRAPTARHLKPLSSNLDVDDRELAKVGHLKFKSHDFPEIQITVTTYPVDGLREDVVLRILTV